MAQVPSNTHQPLDEEALARKTPRTPLLQVKTHHLPGMPWYALSSSAHSQEIQNAISMRGPMSMDEYMREVTHDACGMCDDMCDV